jgi:futalosine hydrolase
VNILIVSATESELAPFAADLRAHPRHRVEMLTTGVGMVATAARCTRALCARQYDLALNLGVCGSFDRALPLGTVVHVVADRVCDLGAEDGDALLTVAELGLVESPALQPRSDSLANTRAPISSALAALPQVSGLTVNTVHGNERSIAGVLARIGKTDRPLVESMEGAGFMYACLLHRLPFAQVRAVSNVVERRNRAAWRMEDAIRNLGAAALAILDTLE